LLAEWQRRKTMVAVIQHAPAGTRIVQNQGCGGPAMRIEIGTDSNDANGQSTPDGAP